MVSFGGLCLELICRVYNNVELVRRANERLLELRWVENGDYVLLSNIYASGGRSVDGVERVRKLLDDKQTTWG